MEEYYSALICVNGHIITWLLDNDEGDKHCSKCGGITISTCQNCGSQIRGLSKDSDYLMIPRDIPPNHCYECGQPYPWTQSRTRAAEDLVDELDNLDEDEKELLKHSIDDLVRETPQTKVAATRFKRLLHKAGGSTAELLKELVVDIVAETTKRMLSP